MYVNDVKDIMLEVGEYRDFCLDIVDAEHILQYINAVKNIETARLVKRLITSNEFTLTFEPFPTLCNFRIAIEFGCMNPKRRFYYPNRNLEDYSNHRKNKNL